MQPPTDQLTSAPDVTDSRETPPVVCISALLEGWTKTKPTKCGYYWVKGKAPRHHNPQILRFRIIAKMGGGQCIQPEGGALSTEGWEWFCGPIPKPANAPLEPSARTSKNHE